MTSPDLSTLSRDARLRREASNCLSIAVRQDDVEIIGQLLDEALRLAARAREIESATQAREREK